MPKRHKSKKSQWQPYCSFWMKLDLVMLGMVLGIILSLSTYLFITHQANYSIIRNKVQIQSNPTLGNGLKTCVTY